MNDYEVYQEIDGHRIYVTVSAEIDPNDALRIANKHFKLNRLCLKIEAGYTIDDDMYFGYPDKKDKKAKPVWVVSKKAR